MASGEQEVSIGRCISVLYRHAQAQISKQLRPLGIGSGQYSVLLVLAKQDGLMQDKISSILQMDKATVARAIARLEKTGYIRRQSDARDKRIRKIHITDEGLMALPAIRKVLSDWNQLVSSGLSQTEKNMVLNILQTMTANVGHKWQ